MFGKGRGFITGFTLGLGTGLVLRELLPIVKEVAAPISKAAIKAGVQIYEKGQEILWGTVESVEDVVAEAKYEYQDKKVKKKVVKSKATAKSPKTSRSKKTIAEDNIQAEAV